MFLIALILALNLFTALPQIEGTVISLQKLQKLLSLKLLVLYLSLKLTTTLDTFNSQDVSAN